MTKDKALRLALEALEYTGLKWPQVEEAITAIKAALEAKDEPVAWISPSELLVMRGNALGGAKDWRVNVGLKPEDGDVGLYTAPPQRKPLTDEEIKQIWLNGKDHGDDWLDVQAIARAIEAALLEKQK